MAQLISLSSLTRERQYDLGQDHYDPTGATAYGVNGEKIGRVVDALAEDGGKLRYLVVEVGGWFSSKHVALPVGTARFDDADHAVYFDNLTREQAKAMTEYVPGQDYAFESQASDERVLRGREYVGDIGQIGATDTTSATAGTDRGYNYRDDVTDDTLYKTPQRLRLLEERLLVNKERYQAGRVTVGKRVETHQENVAVELSHDEVVIERHAVTDGRPVDGSVTLGAATETLRVDLEAERAHVQKQAYVTEEVEIGKRTETEHQTFSDTVGKEVLDVTQTGEVQMTGDAHTTDPKRDRR